MTDKFHFMPDKFHLMPETTTPHTLSSSCGFRHKVKLAHQRNQQLTRTVPALHEILVRHNVKFSYRFAA